MVSNFLWNVAMMIMLITLGGLSLIIAMRSPTWLLMVMICIALVDFFSAWLCYRDASRYAKTIDKWLNSMGMQMELHQSLLKTIKSIVFAPDADEQGEEDCPV